MRAIEVVPGFANAGSKSHVLLAACREDERAKEGRYRANEPPGASDEISHRTETEAQSSGATVAQADAPTVRGLFTAVLLDRLQKEATDQTTYADLMKGLKIEGQNPQCEGHNVGSLLFKGLIASAGHLYFPVTLENGQYIVEAGYAHGISQGVFFSLFETGKFGAGESVLAPVKASSVRSFRTTLSKITSKTLPAKLSVIPTSAGEEEAMLLHIPDLQKLRSVHNAFLAVRPRSETDHPIIDLADQHEAHLVTCLRADGQTVEYFLQLSNLSQFTSLPMRRLRGITKAETNLVLPVLRLASRFAWHLRREVGRSGLKNNLVVEMFKAEEDDDGDWDEDLQPPFKKMGPNVCGGESANVVADGQTPYVLHITSKFNVELHVWAFYFDCSDLSITEYYRPAVSGEGAAASLPGRGTVSLGYGANGGRPYHFTLRDGDTDDVGFIRLFVSSQYIDLSHIPQASPFNADDVLGAKGSAVRTGAGDMVKQMVKPMGRRRDRAVTSRIAKQFEKNSQGTALIWDVVTIAVFQNKTESLAQKRAADCCIVV